MSYHDKETHLLYLFTETLLFIFCSQGQKILPEDSTQTLEVSVLKSICKYY